MQVMEEIWGLMVEEQKEMIIITCFWLDVGAGLFWIVAQVVLGFTKTTHSFWSIEKQTHVSLSWLHLKKKVPRSSSLSIVDNTDSAWAGPEQPDTFRQAKRSIGQYEHSFESDEDTVPPVSGSNVAFIGNAKDGEASSKLELQEICFKL